ncbi:MAG: hypothetical protein CL670_04365 [Balneola sp.]|jgi:hypothetical protein|nr:hypothetical protein [Balneola sp.]MBE78365.1 hypothetical protein [Balneola sp.]|tara:strand:+ start:38035 stop:38223 length:189 start_codon:yes stop_codon:yes gene_type:complete
MNKYILWMIIGCGAVFLFLFIAPALGLNKGIATALAIVAMLACHILMIGHHRKGSEPQSNKY